jgi:hypothetical protein
MLPGTAILLLIPGMEAQSSQVVEGTPEETYRFELQGTVHDGQGGIWEVVGLSEDDRGYTAISYVLTEGALADPANVLVEGFGICQRIADGPAEVTIAVSPWITTTGFKTGKQSFVMNHKTGDIFENCHIYDGNLPAYEQDYRVFITNPHQDPASLTVNGETQTLEPGARVAFNGNSNGSPLTFSSSAILPVVFYSDSEDLNLVSLDSRDHRNWMIPHLARDTASWENRWIFANDKPMTLFWKQGEASFNEDYASGIHALDVAPQQSGDPAWAQAIGTGPNNGFFQFSRADGKTGGAWVGAQRVPGDGNVDTTELYLPHVAADTASFWTGYSLANANEVDAEVTMWALDTDGIVGAETFTIPAGANEIGVVGVDRLVGLQGISWIKIQSDQPIAGVELIGAVGTEDPNFSGFLLPTETADRLAFPAVRTDEGLWTGLALINPTDMMHQGTLTWYDGSGNVVSQEQSDLQAGEKRLWQAPAGAEHVCWSGEGVIGFALVGQLDGSKIGGYLGLPF